MELLATTPVLATVASGVSAAGITLPEITVNGAFFENGRIYGFLKRGREQRLVDATHWDLASPIDLETLWRESEVDDCRREIVRKGVAS